MEMCEGKVSHGDFLEEGKWITLLSGFSQSRNLTYIIYRIFLFAILIYMLITELLACIFKPEKRLMVEVAHSALGTVFGIWALASRILAYKSVSRMKEILQSGVFLYENEEEDGDMVKLRESIDQEIRSKTNLFVSMNVMGALSNAIIFPASQLLLLDPASVEDSDILNPYLPHVYYQPFDTRTLHGFLFAWLLGFLYFCILYSVAVAANWVYLNCAVQMKVHLQVLNHSIKNIHRRASIEYFRQGVGVEPTKIERILRDEEFERCLYACIKRNVKHHQALLKLKKASEPFCGSYLLDVFTLASMIFGTQLYLICQVSPINIMVSLVASFIAEQFTAIYVCMLGENVLNESQKIFERLYKVSWFNYSKRFNQILYVMMSNTMKPIGLRAMLFGVPASLQVYGDIVSAMYKIASLVRHSEVV